MKLKPTAVDACTAINIAGREYSPDADGTVTITDPEHIELAVREGFAEVPATQNPEE